MGAKPVCESFRDNVVVEFVGTEILILDLAQNRVHTFPGSYRDTVGEIMCGEAVQNTKQLADISGLGLLRKPTASQLSRRSLIAVAGVAGAGWAALSMPAAAMAASATFTMDDERFVWAITLADDPEHPSLWIAAATLAPLYEDIFIPSESWTLTVTIGFDTLTAEATVPDPFETGALVIAFNFPGDFSGLDPATIIRARLSGPRGELSNFFNVSKSP